jgi:hypothetical protein
MSVVIKNFGDDTPCETLKDLKLALREKYKLMSVSIIYKADSQLKKVEFVDVLADGTLIGTYHEKPVPFDFFGLPT